MACFTLKDYAWRKSREMALVDLEAAKTNRIIDFSGIFFQNVRLHTLSSPQGKQLGWRLRKWFWKNFTIITTETVAFILELLLDAIINDTRRLLLAGYRGA